MDSTTRLGLNKPNPDPETGDFVDVAKLNENFDKIDSSIGATVCTSTTRPAIPFDGQFIREVDTRRLYVWNASQTTWEQIATPGPARFRFPFDVERDSIGQTFYNGYITGDANPRFSVLGDGKLAWGTGAGGFDLNLYRASTNNLRTDQHLTVGQNLTANGTVSFPAMGPIMAESTTAINSITNTGGTPGTPVVAFSFTAPPSGTVWVSITGNISMSTNGNNIYLGYQLYQGSATIGSGTLYRSFNVTQALSAGKAVVTGGANETGATRRFPVDGLTPGGVCNIRLGHWVSPAGTGAITYRQLCIERVL